MDLNRILYECANRGYVEECKRCIEKGANVNYKYARDDTTALHKAVELEHIECVKILLEAGADINIKDINESAPLHFARSVSCLELLLKNKNIQIDIRNNAGKTPLQIASARGDIECIKMLLQHGADINNKDDSGCAPLHFAILNDKEDSVKVLLHYGADIHLKNGHCRNAKELAIIEHKEHIAKLIDRRVFLNVKPCC